MARDIRRRDSSVPARRGKVETSKTLPAAILEIFAADLGMSLDNILGVTGAAHNHYYILAVGLVLSVALTGVAATSSAKLFQRFPWLGWAGIATVLYVAVEMIASGIAPLTK
jgi:predicted tellurium resistance membrane protein TerC